MTFTKPGLRQLFTLFLSASILSSCGTDHKIKFDVGSSYNFGSVNLTNKAEKTITLTNASDETVHLKEVSESGLGLSGDFYLVGGTCSSGLKMAKKETCTLIIGYKPTSLGLNTQVVKVSYLEADKKKTHNDKVTLTGRGEVDCSVASNLNEKYISGKEEAAERNVLETARGKASGEALTYSDGATEGKSKGYQLGYQAGYYSPYGYDDGHDDGYASGYNYGKNSTYACSAGSSDGYDEGASDGKSDGDYEGYNDGYDYGESEGYYDYDCSEGWSSESPTPDLGTSEFELACYQKGYVEVVDTNAYTSAYAAAKAANVEYNNGYDTAYTTWYNYGEQDGVDQGYDDGESDGFDDGEAYGESVAYDDCYSSGYTDGYQYSFATNYSASWDEGYDDGWYDGYSDAENSCSFSSASSPDSKTKRYGQDRDWSKILEDGTVLDKHIYTEFTTKRAQKLIPEGERFKLLFDLAKFRGATSEAIAKEKIRLKLVK